jgi:hypothetical protein
MDPVVAKSFQKSSEVRIGRGFLSVVAGFFAKSERSIPPVDNLAKT